MKRKSLLMILTALAAPVSQAAVIQTTPDLEWNNVNTWGGAALSGAETYQANARFYSPSGGGSFDGGFLEMATGSNLQLQNVTGSANQITANFILSAGQMGPRFSATGAEPWTQVGGSMLVTTSASFRFLSRNDSATTFRNLRVDAQISGGIGATLSLDGAGTIDTTPGTQYIQFSNLLNSFAGTWDIDGTRAIFTDALAVGGGDVIISNDGYLRVNTDWSGSSLTAVTGSLVTVNGGTTFTFDNLTFNSNAVAANTYTVSEINTLVGATLFDGSGTIVVVPEPGTALLGGLGLLGLLRRRRN